MTSTTDTNDAAIAGAGSDAPATETLPPALFARDRRKYTRHLSPLHTGPGLQLFESPEHEALGDGLTFVDAKGNTFTQSPPNTNYFPNAAGQSFSFGQILALAGDFYGLPSQPISDASGDAAQQQRFTQAFNTLYDEPIVFGSSTASNLLSIMQDQSTAVDAAAAQIQVAQPNATDVWSQAYSQTNDGAQFDQRYNLATGASYALPWWASEGTYLQLAKTNWDHFGTHAVAAYRAGHACALQAAATGNYQLAYSMEAFACHFLTDLFSSGHLRTPRKQLHTNNPASDLCSRLMHDEDCYNGLVVQLPDASASWIAYGDKRLNDTLNADNFARAKNAVQVSLGEVITALSKRDPSPVYGALSLIPDLTLVSNGLNTTNWSPLYIVANGEAQQRRVLTDLSCRSWSDDFLYVSTYWDMPDGGIHSLAGAPPGKGTVLAHPITWQSHRIIDSSQDDLAPSAALVTNYDPTLTNMLPPSSLQGTPVMPNQVNTAQQNALCTVFRKTSSDSSNHHVHFLAIPMTDAPVFKTYTSSEISLGTSSKIVTDGGDPTLVAILGGLLLVFPGDDGTLYQANWFLANRAWSSAASNGRQPALSATDSGNYKLLAPPGGDAAPRVAICNLGDAGMYVAFPARSVPQSTGNIVISSWSDHGFFNTPLPIFYPDASGAMVYPKTTYSVSLVEFDGTLVMAFADAASNNQVRVLQRSDSNKWTLLAGAVLDANGNAITTHSVLTLVPYGGSLMLAVNDSSGNIYTYAYDRRNSQWINRLIQGKSNGSKAAPLQTKYALSGVSFEGAAYVVFTDKANGAPSIMTTAQSA